MTERSEKQRARKTVRPHADSNEGTVATPGTDGPTAGEAPRVSAVRDRLGRIADVVSGHVWTLVPHLRHTLAPLRAPDGEPWSADIDDPAVGRVRIGGTLRHEPGAKTLAVLVHGLGGSAHSAYVIKTAQAVARKGWSSLRVNLRGADGAGEDFYHAALVGDLDAALRSEAVARYERVVVLGFSLGGHLALWHGLRPDPRVTGIVAVCSPLDLAGSSKMIDRRRSSPYRLHVLGSLKQDYAAVARSRDVPYPEAQAQRITTIRDWDHHVVVPRHGFASVDDYYARASVGPRLDALRVRSLYIGGRDDPMVPPSVVDPSLEAATAAGVPLTVRWLDGGGHVGFPPSAAAAGRTLEDDSVDWLDEG